MKEKIILAPGASSSELLRSLAKNGVNTIGLRVMSSLELARFALMKSGVSMTEEFLTHAEEPAVIYSFLNEIAYFKTASYADAENIATTLNLARGLIATDDSALNEILKDGEFPEKNAALLEVFRRYQRECAASNKLDSIGLLRKAIADKASFSGNYDFYYINELPIQPIDEALLSAVSGGNFKGLDLIELFGVAQNSLQEIDITEGYGEINEVKNIIDNIYSRGLPLDKCLIACAGAGYSQVFFDLAKAHDIPITFGSGVPISNTNPARLLKTMQEWNITGYNGIDSLRKLLYCEGLDRKELFKAIAGTETLSNSEVQEIVKIGGSLRISLDAEENKKRLDNFKAVRGESDALARTEKLASELGNGMAEFIERFALIRPEPIGRIDQSAVNVIVSTMKAYERYAPDGNVNEIIPELLGKTVCSENSKEGALHITSIQAAMTCMRENLYVCGLSAGNFPGSPTENYLLLDNDLKQFSDVDEERIPTSENRIKAKKKALDNLLGIAASLGVKVKLSYSGYSLSELKAQNPSSVLYGICESVHNGISMDDFRTSIRKAEFFEAGIDADRIIGDEYSKGSEIGFGKYEAEKTTVEEALQKALEKEWSPSYLSTFFQCPRHFYLRHVLGIPEDQPDNPFEILSAADIGTLAHSLMEGLAEDYLDRDAFLAKASEVYDQALVARPPLHPAEVKQNKKEFLEMMATAYDTDVRNEVVSAEHRYAGEHSTGVKIKGFIDRVEKTPDGKFVVADFKTKRKIEHVEDDFDTCMQVVVYAWLCEQAGMDISSCEYRYLRKGRTISCKYDDSMREALDNFLRGFKESIENNDFQRNENDVSCKYCMMKDVCKWDE